MAVVYIQDMLTGTRDMVEAVTKEMDVEHDPPVGMILHTAMLLPTGGTRIIDVWESKEAHEAFERDRLQPALQTVFQRFGIDPQAVEPPDQTWLDTFDVKLGR